MRRHAPARADVNLPPLRCLRAAADRGIDLPDAAPVAGRSWTAAAHAPRERRACAGTVSRPETPA
ncbi:MAG: hypothetical protein IT520_11675 [Burkholderiales bacterium]|nr:hypothetical protein [Burkholderiales bacterium]